MSGSATAVVRTPVPADISIKRGAYLEVESGSDLALSIATALAEGYQGLILAAGTFTLSALYTFTDTNFEFIGRDKALTTIVGHILVAGTSTVKFTDLTLQTNLASTYALQTTGTGSVTVTDCDLVSSANHDANVVRADSGTQRFHGNCTIQALNTTRTANVCHIVADAYVEGELTITTNASAAIDYIDVNGGGNLYAEGATIRLEGLGRIAHFNGEIRIGKLFHSSISSSIDYVLEVRAHASAEVLIINEVSTAWDIDGPVSLFLYNTSGDADINDHYSAFRISRLTHLRCSVANPLGGITAPTAAAISAGAAN